MDLCNGSSLAAELVWRGHRLDSYLMTVHQPPHCLHPQFFHELRVCWQCMSAVIAHGNVQQPDIDLIARDRAHAAYTKLQQLLITIRASPGLEKFMRGSSYSDLMQIASAHPVVIVAASDTACHALVIHSASISPTHLVLNKIASADLDLLGHDIRGLDLNVRAFSRLSVATGERGIIINGLSVNGRNMDPAVRKLHQALKRLWVGVVKPVLDCLGLQVRGVTLDAPCL
jgi:hypothetical protein